MLFLDDESRHMFHQSSTLLQIICQMLEFECAKHSAQVELIACESGLAIMGVQQITFDQLTDACQTVNKQFQRVDKTFTCKISERRMGIVECYASDLADYKELT